MSHISKCTLKVKLSDESTLKNALKLMEKEGYKIITTEKGYAIDLTSKGIKHSYHRSASEAHWSQIQLEKTTGEGGKMEFIAKGDPYSIREGYETAVKTLEKSYAIAGTQQALMMLQFMQASVQTEKPANSKSMGKVVLRSMRV